MERMLPFLGREEFPVLLFTRLVHRVGLEPNYG
jgi:hypothetical protein